MSNSDIYKVETTGAKVICALAVVGIVLVAFWIGGAL